MFILCIFVDYELSVRLQLHHTHSHQLLFNKKDRKTDCKQRVSIGRVHWQEGQRETESNREAVIIIVDELAFPMATEHSEALRKDQDC